ncbi:hypothetical protein C8R44DRAFT_890054 [Mycena epipterygia]|nr:hypothetical protein C8R44DRAFT_890054 [Mycena epipterygia]
MRAFILSSAAIILGLLVPKGFSVPLSTTLLTPGGYHANANMHEVPVGGCIAHVGAEIHVIDPNGGLIHVALPKPTTTAPVVAPQPEETGWVAYAYWSNPGPSPISSFTTTWTVPPAPITDNGQTIFLFNSIEPSSGDGILQPVLQYGCSTAGGSNYWSVATWYIYQDQIFYTNLVPVDVGQTLNGIVSLVRQSGLTYTYTSEFGNVAGTSLTVNGTEELTFATETLEVYSVTKESDFPPGSTEFSQINLILSSGVTPSVGWYALSNTADKLGTIVNVDGAMNGKITIMY